MALSNVRGFYIYGNGSNKWTCEIHVQKDPTSPVQVVKQEREKGKWLWGLFMLIWNTWSEAKKL